MARCKATEFENIPMAIFTRDNFSKIKRMERASFSKRLITLGNLGFGTWENNNSTGRFLVRKSEVIYLLHLLDQKDWKKRGQKICQSHLIHGSTEDF